MTAARPFRAHTELPDTIDNMHAARPVLAGLVQEWVELCARSSTTRTVQRWSRAHAALLEATSLGELVDAIDLADYPAKDAALAALLALHQSGSTLAGRVLLQVLLPQLANTGARAHRQRLEASDDGDHMVVATFWDVLSEYPPEDAGFASLASTTWSRIRRQLSRSRLQAHTETAASDHLEADWHINTSTAADELPNGELDADGDLEMLTSWAITADVLTRKEADVLVVGLCSGQGRIDKLAQMLGCSNESARQQLSRIRARVITAARESLHADAIEAAA